MTSAVLDRIGSIFSSAVCSSRQVEPCLAWSRRLRLGDTPEAQVDGTRRPVPFVPDAAQTAILAAVNDDRYQSIAIAGPVQAGKTLSGVNVPISWCLSELRQPCLLAGPRVDEAVMAWRDKTRPLLIDSGLEWVLPVEGNGSKTGNPDSILATTGARLYLRSSGGANESGQSAVTVRLAVVTEVDSIAISARKSRRKAGEGDPGRRKIDLFSARTAAYGPSGRVILESTVKLDDGSLILALVEEGTCGRLHHPCPHCGGWSPREPEHLHYDDTSAASAFATAHLVCPGCGVLIDAATASECARDALVVHRGQRVVARRVEGDPPSTTTWSLRYLSLDVPHRHLGWIAQKRWNARDALMQRGDHEPLRQYTRDHEVRGYRAADADDRRVRVQPAIVASRSAASSYRAGSTPWPGIITLGVDWQEREAWWSALASDGDRAAIIGYGVEYLCHRHEQPTPEQRLAVCDRLEAIASAGWVLPDGSVHPTAGRICDLGGRGWIDVLESWMRAGRWRWWGARGDGRQDPGAGQSVYRLPGWYDRHDRTDGRRLLMCPPDIKGRILAGLLAPADSPVALLVPQGIAPTDHLARQITAERCEPGANGSQVWVPVYHQNHLLDATLYAWSLARYLSDHQHHTTTGDAAPISWVRSR